MGLRRGGGSSTGPGFFLMSEGGPMYISELVVKKARQRNLAASGQAMARAVTRAKAPLYRSIP